MLMQMMMNTMMIDANIVSRMFELLKSYEK